MIVTNKNTFSALHFHIIFLLLAVAQLVEALHYKPEGRGFDF
jgi:hypothetical protein